MPFNYVSMMRSKIHNEVSSVFPDITNIDSHRNTNKKQKVIQDIDFEMLV